MKTQLFTFLSFVLSFAVLGEVKVQKAPLKSLLIDNASVVTDVTGTDAAKRLEAEGGKSWIDGDGRVYRVERKASFRGLSAVSADNPDSTVQWSFDYPGAEYCDLSYDPPSRWYLSYGRMEDVENDGVIWQEEVQYVYEGAAPWSASSVTMKRKHYNEEFVLSLAFVTNAADRFATTGEVARIASGLGGGLTTNDVCAIVTNTLPGGWSEWRKNPGWKDPPDTRNAELVHAWDNVWDFRYEDYWNGDWIASVGNYVEIDEGQTRVDAFTGCWFEREWIPGGNALGLAMAKDVEKKFAEATNAIPSIVTNEVVVVSEWSAWSYTYLNFIEPNYDPYIDVQSLEWVESGNVEDCTFPCWKGVFTCKGWNGGYFTGVAYSGFQLGRGGRDSEEVILYTGTVCDEGFKARRVKIEKRANALGLATLNDIEGAVTVDEYDTNSVYFIDGDIPTMKLFTSYMRSPYWMNRMSAIEIGDKSQVLKTHYLQVDGNLAVNSPENIRFMSTLDRNSAFGEGKALSLQDYLDAFNPVLLPDTIRMFQTNRSDYSVGNVTAHESLTVAKKDGGVAFKVTPDEANFMDVLKVKPTVGPLLYYPGQTNENGVVTNYYGYAETNANIKLEGNLHVTDSTAISSNLTVWGKLLLSSWENLRLAWKPYENDINNGKDCGYQQTLAEYVGNLVKPLVAATNEYAMGDEVIEVHTCTTNATSPLSRNGRIETVKDNVALLVTKNKATYVWDHDKVLTALGNKNVPTWVSVSNAQLWVSSPGGIVGHQGKSENPRLDVKVIFDLSAWSYKVNLDVGTWNFVGMGDRVGAEGEWETIYSSVKPTERTETVIHTETYTWYDEYWDDELGEWVVDYDNPITETYEWYDEYTNNMIFEIEPYTCVEFHFKQVGPKAMKVDVQELYKTNPVR